MRLVLDTSSTNVSIGVLSGDKWMFATDHDEPTPQQSKLVLSTIRDELTFHEIAIKDIKELAIGIGPGSYTGLRVGLTIAKIWAFSMKVKLFEFSSEKLLERTQAKEPKAAFPKVKYLELEDFQWVKDLQELKPVYRNDHFA